MENYSKKTTPKMTDEEKAEGMSHSIAVMGRRPGTLHQLDTSSHLLTRPSSNHFPKTHPIHGSSPLHFSPEMADG